MLLCRKVENLDLELKILIYLNGLEETLILSRGVYNQAVMFIGHKSIWFSHFFSSQGWIKSPHIVYFWAYLIQQNWPENSQQRLVNQLDTAAKFFAKKFTTTTFCKGCYFPAGLLKQKKVKKKRNNTVKEIQRRRSFSRVLSFWNKSLWTRANLETKEKQIPMVSHTEKKGATENKKSPGPWLV